LKFFIQFFLCGILTGFLFPPFFLIPIGFIIFPYLFHLSQSKQFISLNYKYHFFSGFFYGLGFFSIYLMWIKEPFFLDDLTKNYFIFSYLLIIYCSLFFGVIFFILKFFNNILIKFIVFPGLIVSAECLCANLSYGFPWFSFSLIHAANFAGTSIIFYTGTYGLSFISLVIFLFPAFFLINELNEKKIILKTYLILFIVLALLIISRVKSNDINFTNQINVSLAQINLPINQMLNNSKIEDKFEYIIDTIKKNNSDIVVFAENNYPFILEKKDSQILQNSLKPGTSLIIGSTRKESENYFNSMFLIDQEKISKFDKKILVPFGEFIPLRKFFGFMDFIAGSVDYSVGEGTRKLKLSDKIKILPVICYEIVYFWEMLDQKNIDTNIIINITNDSWFGNFSGPYQHFYFSKLRAAEFNKPLIRVSNNGISAAIDNYGTIIDFIGLNNQLTKEIKVYIPDVQMNYLLLHKLIMFIIFLSIIIGLLINRLYDSK